jgi:phosphoglycerate dehydrogenase-like enzyme
LPNVILTQHVAGASPHNSRRVTDQFSENLHRYMNGYPLLNVVDPRRGF